jgi:phenylpropionate dioxygenase-like ring-hydroxylating dioxygenase large terminal subunit
VGVISIAKSLWAGYPGGYKKYARGTQPASAAPPFQQPDDPNDLRSKIPPLGHREYWYPALPEKDVKSDKPSVLRLLGDDIVFFRGKDGKVKALKDACPHRGAYLSLGNCFYKGTVTCPYHGATFDGEGNCVAFLTEGPDSKLVGEMKAWPYPTETVRGMVFVWMGQNQPVDIHEDVPPEMFEPNNIVRYSFCMFHCNWIVVLENTNDAHNAFFVHRNCVNVLRSRTGGRPRTPLGYRTKIVDGKAANYHAGTGVAPTERYYFDEDGKVPYQMYYPGVDGVWPLHRYRLLWTWIWDRIGLRAVGNLPRGSNYQRVGNADDAWLGTRLPGMSRTGGANARFRSTRWPVPVERDLTRMVYLNVERYAEPPSLFTRIRSAVQWPSRNWSLNFNFRNPDYDAERTCQYSLPEYLSATDSTVVAIRKLLAEYGRGAKDIEEVTREDELIEERNKKVADEAQTVLAGAIKEGLAKVRS